MTNPTKRLLPTLLLALLVAASAGATAAEQKGKAKAKPKPAPRPAAAAAAPAAAAATSSDRFDDWKLGCERRPGAAPGVSKESCFVEQRLSTKETPDRLALAVAIGFFAPEGKPAMIIKLPPAAIQEAGIIIQVDERPLREVGIRNCGTDNCSVMALLDDDMLKELSDGKKAVVAYSRQQTDEIVRVPVSLRGLTKGLTALRKRV